MKNITKFYIFLTAIILTLSSNAFAENKKRQIVRDGKKLNTKIINNETEESTEINDKFYLGMDVFYQNSTLGGGTKNPYDYYEPQTSSVAAFVGYDNQDFFKIESFYSRANEKNQIISVNNLSSYELKTKTFGVDFKPYLNFDKESRALFYLIFGLNYNQIYTAEVNQVKTYGIFSGVTTKTTSRNSSLSKISPSWGLGIEYLCYRNFVLRFQYKRNYVDAKITNSEVLNKVKVIENLGIGISHSF
jgi:hypothetical protein